MKNDFNIERDGALFEKQKEIFNELLNERAHEYDNLKNKIDPNEFVYSYKTEGNSSKDYYWKPLD